MEAKVKIIQSSGKHFQKVIAKLETELQELPTGAVVGPITHSCVLSFGTPIHHCCVLWQDAPNVADPTDLRAALNYLWNKADVFQKYVQPDRMMPGFSEGAEIRRKQLQTALEQAGTVLRDSKQARGRR